MPALDSIITALTIAKATTAGLPVPGLSAAFEYALAIAEKAKEIEDLQDDCRVLAERAANFLLDVNEQLKLCNGNVVSKEYIQNLICTLLDIESLMHRRLRKDKKGRFIRMLRDQDEIANEVKALNVKLDDCLRTFATRATIDLDQRMDVLTNANVHFLQYVEDSARIGSLVLAETRGLRADVASLSTHRVLDCRDSSTIVNTNRDRSGALNSSEVDDSTEVDLFRIVGLLNGSGRYSGFRIFARVGDTVWDWRLAFSLLKSPTTPSCGLIYGSQPRATLSDADSSYISFRRRMHSGAGKKGLRWLWEFSEASAARLCVVSPPLPRDAGGGAKVILWNIEGHDQGWGGERGCQGTFIGAFSWYEACIFRKSTPSDPGASDHRDKEFWDQFVASQDALYTHPDDIIPDIRPLGYTVVPNGDGQTTWLVQRNRVADDTCGRYEVKWDDRAPSSYIDSILTWMYQWNDTYKGQQATMGGYGIGKGFLDALRPGDRVGLWARAQYSGWENVLRDATVKICF